MVRQDFDNEVESTEDDYLLKYIESLQDSARYFIERYFEDKDFHCGGPIPKNALFSQSSINLVISTPFCEGVQECYRVMPKTEPPPSFDTRWFSWEVDCFLPIFASVRAVGIPKEFQAGMMLLYFKLCEGCEVEEKTLDISHIFQYVRVTK